MTFRVLQQVQDERSVRGGRRLTVAYRDATGVPAVLLVPPHGQPPAGTVLLVHGRASGKEEVADTIGRLLLTHGVASLAIDLPLHVAHQSPLPPSSRGDRTDASDSAQPGVIDMLAHWSASIANATLGLQYLRTLPDAPTRVGVVGYSLGCFVALAIAAHDPAVAAIVLAAGGDIPVHTASESVVRRIIDPVAWLHALAGRPVLMMNGRRDETMRPDQAERLYAAASQPKEQRWHDGDAWLPPQAVQYGAEWLAARLAERPATVGTA